MISYLLVILKMTYMLCTKELNDNVDHLILTVFMISGWITNHLVSPPNLPQRNNMVKVKGLYSLLNSPCKVI